MGFRATLLVRKFNVAVKYYIVHLPSKISKIAGIIATLRDFVPLATLHRIHISLILCYPLYGLYKGERAQKY